MSKAVTVNLNKVRENALAIRRQSGVLIIAVVKADAYGLGAAEVARTIADLVEAFYVFDSAEAVAANLWKLTGRRSIALNSSWTDPDDFLSNHISPVVWSVDRATHLQTAHPVLSVDTGQQRFAAPVAIVDAVCLAGDCREAMTHAVNIEQLERFKAVADRWPRGEMFMHAAGSALLNEPTARLNAVRPGLALYRGAVRVSSTLLEVRDSTGPAGYTGFAIPRFGVILGGYSDGVRAGPCRVNGQLRRIVEVGMQSCFVELGSHDRVGDEVILLGPEPGVDEQSVATAWGASQQEVLVRLTKLSRRDYLR